MNIFRILIFNLLLIQIGKIESSETIDGWNHSSGNIQSHRFTHLKQISKLNIKNLKPAWIHHSGEIEPTETVQTSPIFVDGKVISVTLKGNVYAVNPGDGKLLWKTYIGQPAGRRGLSSYMHKSPKLFVPNGEGIVEIDSSSGKILHRYLSGASLVAPIIYKDKIIIATVDNGIKAYNINTKDQIWHVNLEKNNVIPRIWSGFSIEPALGLGYAVTGSSDGLTGFNRGDSDNSVSIIAIDLDEGKIAWSFQHIHHDVWDLDLIGNPIIFNLIGNKKADFVVTILSKAGDILVLNAKNGEPFFEDSFVNVSVQQSTLKGEKLSKFQKIYYLPEPYSNTIIDPKNDFDHLDKINSRYVNTKLRNAKYGFFIPPSVDYDVAMFGLHGGANWFGGSLDLSSDEPEITIPYNRDPWILRAYYQDKIHYFLIRIIKKIQDYFNPPNQAYLSPWVEMKSKQSQLADKIYSYLPLTPNNEKYVTDCSSCHGIARQGVYQDEAEGDLLYPPLVGLTFTEKFKKVNNVSSLTSLHNEFNISLNISSEEYSKMLDEFRKYDERLKAFNMLGYSSFWQLLLDKDGYPATKPPWGMIAKSNLISGDIVWKKTFGKRIDNNGRLISMGDKNFGGVMTTASQIIFATGTPDKNIYAFDAESGEEIWNYELPYAGSAPPMSYQHNGCQFIAIQATGGKYVGYEKNKGDALVSFALEECLQN